MARVAAASIIFHLLKTLCLGTHLLNTHTTGLLTETVPVFISFLLNLQCRGIQSRQTVWTEGHACSRSGCHRGYLLVMLYRAVCQQIFQKQEEALIELRAPSFQLSTY